MTGLSLAEVRARKNAGQVNLGVTSASPSYPWIVFRNVFNLINVFLLPLLIALFYFGRYLDVFAMSTFAVINSLVSMWDEIRIKRRLDRIHLQFTRRVEVLRGSTYVQIPTQELVLGDIVVVREGESVPTEGEILLVNNLQVDESLLTGESNYISKEIGEQVLGGSFIITGECHYKVTAVGKNSYINKLSAQSQSFRKEKSKLQQIGDTLTIFFVASSVIFGAVAFFSARYLDYQVGDAVVPLTTVVSLIIPQTLIFLFTFTFSISSVRLSNRGVLVQRGSAIESLARLDILCFDKTGTITSGDMEVADVKYWNTKVPDIAKGFNYLSDKIFGRNKTFITLANYFRSQDGEQYEVAEFTQIPFTSKTKVAKNRLEFEGNGKLDFVYGAANVVIDFVTPDLVAEVNSFVAAQEDKGRRVILGVIHQPESDSADLADPFTSNRVWAMSLTEQLNPGLSDTFAQFQKLGTTLKIISGDSDKSVARILEASGIELSPSIDLSEYGGKAGELANSHSVFTRAKPEDKLSIIKALQSQGKQVGMVGDGVNDVLALKLSNLSIAMESGAKAAQDVSDIVLLQNNFNLVPQIIFEGENVITNLKFMNLLFVTKTFHAILFVIACATVGMLFPLEPASILIYGFLATSLPSYAIAFFRRQVDAKRQFWADVLPDSFLAGIIGTLVSMNIYLSNSELLPRVINTYVMYGTFSFAMLFAIFQLIKNGYIHKWWQPILTFAVISIIGFIATLFPLLNYYYRVENIGLQSWLYLNAVGFVAFIGYVISQIIVDFGKAWYFRREALRAQAFLQ